MIYTKAKLFYAGRLPNEEETQEEERTLMLPESENRQGKSPDNYNDTSIC